jgi:hypothetical protein
MRRKYKCTWTNPRQINKQQRNNSYIGRRNTNISLRVQNARRNVPKAKESAAIYLPAEKRSQRKELTLDIPNPKPNLAINIKKIDN